MYEVPFAHSYYGVVSDAQTQKEFYENNDKVDNLYRRYNGYIDRGEREKAQGLFERKKGIMMLRPQLKAIRKQMRYLRKAQDMYHKRAHEGETKADRKEASKQADKIGETIHEMHLSFNRMMNQAEDNLTKNPAEFLTRPQEAQ
jgi:hypothetical protein